MLLWQELRRRKVVRTAIAYGAVAWLLIQIVVSIEEPLQLPDWTDTLTIVILAVGFPVAVMLAWAYELTPTGIRSERPATDSESRPARGSLLGYLLIAIAAALIGALAIRLISGDSDAVWVYETALPAIEASLDASDWDSAYRLLREAEVRVPGNAELADLWDRVAWRVALNSEPSGATVFRRAYDSDSDEWERLGETPLPDARVPYGLSRLRFDLQGYQSLFRTLGGGHLNWEELRPGGADGLLVNVGEYRLDTNDTKPADMVRISGWTEVLDGNAESMGDFFLQRYEVTNEEFRQFVIDGGYRQKNLWDPVVVDGNEMRWDDAMRLFVDTTGRPGPSTWEAGDYPEGMGEHPVSGVSWYEAAAYARYAGRQLPTVYHWQRAIGIAEFPWLLPASNFGDGGTRAIEQSKAMSYSGVFDLAGNVREWTTNAIGGERVILGGSYNDPYYVAGAPITSAAPLDRAPGNGIRLADIKDPPELQRLAAAPVLIAPEEALVADRDPIDASVYEAYSRVFDYSRRPLESSVDDVSETRNWARERVTFTAGYGEERVILYLYLPANARPPFQTIIYWPGWDTFRLDDVDQYFAKQLDFLLKSGRAVAFPIYKGTFERRIGDQRSRPPFNTAAYRDNTIETVKDLRRTVDYLETRRDIDGRSLAFFGYSWGGVNGPTALVQEPRLRTAIINIGLIPPMDQIPEVDPVNALPRIAVPTLMFSGEFDSIAPLPNARRYFSLIGSPDEEKNHIVAIGGHFVPRDLLIRETLAWLDRYLGVPAF